MFKTYLRTVNKNVRLRRELREVRLREQAKDCRHARLIAELEKVRGQLGQARRDADLLVNFAADPVEAREFLSTQRDIGAL